MKRLTGGEPISRLGRDVAVALHRALVGRELAELTRGRLPPPHDPDAEWCVLAMLADCEDADVRKAVDATWFFLDLHRAVAQAVLEADPRDQQGIARGIARLVHGGAPYANELASRVCSHVYTRGELARAVDRLLELRDARDLLTELERLALALRAETETVDHVRRRLRGLVDV